MSIDRCMDKEDVVRIHDGIVSAIKKSETMPSAATCMVPEITIPTEESQSKTHIICYYLYVESDFLK